MKKTIEKYEIIVVGGGPNGLACAIEAQKNGLQVLVIEKGTIAESIRRYPKQMTFFSTADNISIGEIPFTIDKPKATREEALNYYRKVVEYYNLPLRLFCKVQSLTSENGKFNIHTNLGDTYLSDYVILSTGYFDFPRKLNISGENLPHVTHYYDEPYPYVHQKVAIIGAGNSAVEAALDLYRHGVDVTLIVRGKSMKKTAKYWLIPDLLNRIKEGMITAYYEHEAVAIEEKHVIMKDLSSGKKKKIVSDFVFILTGYLPDVKFIEECGIKVDPLSKEPHFNPSTFETNIRNLYVAGTLTAGIRTEKVFIENGRLHGKHIVMDILSKKAKNH
jgi:thioredoxin reductase (NADPH)